MTIFNCFICNKSSLDRYHVIWMPERSYSCSKVHPICFECCDKFCCIMGKGILKYLKRRERGIKIVNSTFQ